MKRICPGEPCRTHGSKAPKTGLRAICVYCGSSPGGNPAYVQAVRLLGQILAQRKVTLVYGGARVGCMGQLAQSCLDAGGEVIGVILQKLVEMEVAHNGLSQLQIVDSMHERKARMAELSDAFIALPGGLGTFEEFFEILTWAQLGMHGKPCGLLNVCRFYDPLLGFLDQAVKQEFLQQTHRDMIQIDESAEGLLEKFSAYRAPKADKAAWLLRMSREAD